MSELLDALTANSESICRALADSTADFICLATSHGEPFYLNPAGRQMIGLGEDESASARQACTTITAEDSWKELRDVGVPAVNRSGHWEGRSQLRNLQDRRAAGRRRRSCFASSRRKATNPPAWPSASRRRAEGPPPRGPGRIASPQTRHPRILAGPDHHDQPRGHYHRVQPGGGAGLRLSARQGAGDAAGRRPLSPLDQRRPAATASTVTWQAGEGSMLGKRTEVTAVRANGETFPAEMAMTISQEQGGAGADLLHPRHQPAEEGGGAAGPLRRRTGAIQPRPGAIRLRGFARPPGAAAEDPRLRRSPGDEVPRGPGRDRPRVHRAHAERRGADAGPDRRPADASPASPRG